MFETLDYKKALDDHTRLASESIEDTIHEVCESSNEILDSKLHEVFIVLEDIGKLFIEIIIIHC